MKTLNRRSSSGILPEPVARASSLRFAWNAAFTLLRPRASSTLDRQGCLSYDTGWKPVLLHRLEACATGALACFALLALFAFTSQPALAQSSYDHVVIVLDASGSMAANMPGSNLSKMETAKQALKSILQHVPQSTRVGVLVFSAANLPNDWLFPLGPRDDATLLPAIDRIQPKSDTPLGRYMKRAADRLLEERASQLGYGSYRMLVITDGEAQDRDLVDRYTPEIMARGITVDAIGVAMQQNHTLATKVHSYRRANDADSLTRALREVFAELGSSTSDVAQAEAFAAIAALPEASAAAAIQALARSGNHPIGTRPSAPSSPAPVRSQPQPAPRPGVSAVPQAPTPPSPPSVPFQPPTNVRVKVLPVFFALPGIVCLGSIAVLVILLVRFGRKGRH